MGKGLERGDLLRDSGKRRPPSIGKPGWGIVRGKREWQAFSSQTQDSAASGYSAGGVGEVCPTNTPCVTLDQAFVLPATSVSLSLGGGGRGRSSPLRLWRSILYSCLNEVAPPGVLYFELLKVRSVYLTD